MAELAKDRVKTLTNELDDIFIVIPEWSVSGDTISIKDLLKKGHWDIILRSEPEQILYYKTLRSIKGKPFLEKLRLLFF